MQNFATTAAITTVLDIPAGRIQIIATDRTDTTVEVLPANAAKSRDVKAAEQLTVAFADGVLRINGPVAKSQLLGTLGSVEVTVQLPAGSSVEAKAGRRRVPGRRTARGRRLRGCARCGQDRRGRERPGHRPRR
ncbi:hypothetical protein [Kribbella qitaiheensis]|uniref:hypothetical protein n=1 Tax=Kribbella qitaiheensis TaxID=1544730 RepID=UPI001FE9A71D|nr:hypothetical protein [Kribbella qitaiheensis]